jgi:hypothetical protein
MKNRKFRKIVEENIAKLAADVEFFNVHINSIFDRLSDLENASDAEKVWLDVDGFDTEGYDAEGFDREGYDREGYDRSIRGSPRADDNKICDCELCA